MTEVVVAVIASAAPTIAALGTWRNAKKANQILTGANAVLTGNGRGNVAVMAETTLKLVEDLSERQARQSAWMIQHDLLHDLTQTRSN
jgi:hypothetical protein